jgi:AcrR family transcriptional regulator
MSHHSETDIDSACDVGRPSEASARAAGPARDKRASRAIARAMERKSTEIDVRRVPRQARGAATFNAILDATGMLLEEAGPEAVSTNLVAEVAGVNIATLYQYFPSKEAILLALFQRDTDARIRLSDEMLAGVGEDDNWRQRFSDVTDEVVRQRRRQPGAGPLRRAMRASPELQAYERETLIRGARTLAAELMKRGRADASQAEVAALCALEMSTALLDVWALGYAGGLGYQDDRVITELKGLMINYLAPFLDP